MSGSPRKRAAREAREVVAAAAANTSHVPDAREGVTPTPAQSARTVARGPTPIRQTAPGPAVRKAADNAQAAAAATLADELQPGTVVRIERTKPTWCAGWLEDFVLEDGQSAELRDYIREEYGGRTYRLTMLAADNSVLWTTRVPIAGRPREDGRNIDRDEWEGVTSKQETPPAATGIADAGGMLGAIMPLFEKMMDISKSASAAQLEAVHEAVRSSERNQGELMKQLAQTRADERRENSLPGQLQALAESTESVRALGAVFAGDDEPKESGLAGAGDVATKHFMEGVVSRLFNKEGGGESGPPARRAPQVRRVVRRKAPAAAAGGGIPNAIDGK